MKNETNLKRKKIFKIILTIISFVMLLIFIHGLNKPHLYQFHKKLSFDNLKCIAQSSDFGVAVDSQGERILVFDENKNIVNVIDTNSKGSEISIANAVTIKDGKCYILGANLINDGIYYESEVILELDKNGNILKSDKIIEYGENDFVTNSSYDGNLFIHEENKENITELGFSTLFIIDNLLYYISVIYLLVLCAILLIVFCKKYFKISYIFYIVTIFFILIIVVYYSFNFKKNIFNEYNSLITVQSKQVSNMVSAVLSHDIEPDQKFMQSMLKKQAITFGNDKSIYYNVYTYNDENKLVTFAVSKGEGEINVDNLDVEILDKLYSEGSVDKVKKETSNSIDICDYTLIRSKDDKPYMVLEVGYTLKNIISIQTEYCLTMAINLLAIFIVILISYSTFVDLGNDFKNFVKRDKDDYTGKMLDSAGIFRFLLILINGLDAVILVLISNSLCENANPTFKSILISLPIAAFSFGGLVGNYFFNIFITRIGKRSFTFIGSIVSIISFIVIIFAINISSFPLFVIGKFGSGIVISGIFFGISELMPIQGKTEGERAKAYDSLVQTSNAGSILSALIGGYLSQYLSYSMIYVFGIFLAVILLLISMFTFSNAIPSANNKRKSIKNSYIKCWLYMLSPIMLSYLLLFVFPRALQIGYGSYLFPLYSVGAGLSIILLSNISVLSKTLAFAINGILKVTLKKYNQYFIMLSTSIFTSVCFICFIASPNIYWAIAVLFINDIMQNINAASISSYQREIIAKGKINVEQATSDVSILKNLIYVFQSPTLSAFISLGYNFACAAVGIFTTGLFVLFNASNKILRRIKIKNKN